MNESDMELQVIRQKLQSLKAEVPAKEAMPSPWAPPRSRPATSVSPASGPTGKLDVAAAIEMLKQRSSRAYAGYDTSTAGQLIQGCHQFEAELQRFNSLAQQQEAAILRLKQLAEHLTRELSPQELDAHPQLAEIAAFFEIHDSLTVPVIASDHHGRFSVQYHLVDFYQAEREADSTARRLRHRFQERSPQHRWEQPELPLDEPSPELTGSWWSELLTAISDGWNDRSKPLAGKWKRPRQALPSRRSRLSVMDAAIWFSGAAILRMLLDMFVQSYPVLWIPLVGGLIVIVAIALYRTILTYPVNLGFSYRILIALAGLFIGGQFL